MPIYNFFCDRCDREEDVIFSVSEVKALDAAKRTPEYKCEVCGNPMNRMLTKANFTTKPGGGFFGSKPKP